jgi:pimeloyl-ACP methyl ester carboxylesterase
MGGPGEAISAVAERFLALVPALPDRDMLIVDLRGTGRSGRLGCPTLGTAQWVAAGREQVEATARCAQEVGPRRDDYTTVGSVLDIEAIRRALHLPNPSLLGPSYGTWVVQTYTVLFPKLVQAAVIDGVFSAVGIFAIQYTFADYLTAIDRALGGDHRAAKPVSSSATSQR